VIASLTREKGGGRWPWIMRKKETAVVVHESRVGAINASSVTDDMRTYGSRAGEKKGDWGGGTPGGGGRGV